MTMKAILAALLLIVCLAASAPAQQPNIVVFLADDHSLLDSTVYGATSLC